MTPADEICVSTVVALDPRAAFEVFTGEVDGWWKRGPAYRVQRGSDGTMRFEPGPGGRLVQVFEDGETFELGRVLTWEPFHRLAFEFRGPNFRPGESTEVEVRFEAVSSGTRVTLRHTGLAGLPQDHPVRHGLADEAFLRMWGGWWNAQLTSLRLHAPPG